ncbi:MAG: MBL fold metallo-hydrolase [Candidatus Kapabacteria bacterium]|nr:MBL fold metallo-hydrolase [Candidatus Kapabacteria bacterium]MDW8012296.1 MBL fold metallo-hydrolase [Bacteroidota bacterium]
MLQIGRFQIDVVETGRFGLDGGAMFGVVPKPLWEKAYHPADPMNRIPMAARALLIRWDSHAVLVDTGNGSKMSEKQRQIYAIDSSQYSLERSLSYLGLSPEDITAVILTHLHFDHAGGSTYYSPTGELLPTFPKARYYVQRDHLLAARHPTEKDRASFIPEDFEPLASLGLLELLEGEGELFPGIYLLLTHGHTRAMQLVLVSDEGRHLLYCADLCPTAAHIPYPYIMAYDNFPLTTLEEKKRILPRAYEEGWILCFEHDAFVQAGRLQVTPKGFALAEPLTITTYDPLPPQVG